jgi:hypothetical protein
MRKFVLAAITVGLVGIALLGPTATGSVAFAAPPSAPACVPADRCCKVCDEGLACGNSCISRKKQCHKARGCACQATEICGSEK